MIATILIAWIFGQGNGTEIPVPSDPWGFLGSLVGNLTGFAFAGWLAHHLLTVVIPRMTESYTKSIETQARIFAETSTQNVAKFQEALESDRKFREQELAILKEQVKNTVGHVCRFNGDFPLSQLPVQTIQKGNP